MAFPEEALITGGFIFARPPGGAWLTRAFQADTAASGTYAGTGSHACLIRAALARR